MDIIRKELTPDELQNPNNRYDVDCDCTQTTIDGGATWTNNPGIDPRTSTALMLPVPSSSDPRCDSATGITANFRDGLTAALNNLNTTSNVFAGASVILTILDFLDGIGLIIQLFIDFCTLILSIGVELVEADFTDAVYAQFACNLNCDCGDDGTFNAAQFDQLLADNAMSFGETSTVNIILNSWLNGLGFVGLSNVGSVKRTTGDCSDCTCEWCDYFDFTLSDGGWFVPSWWTGFDVRWTAGVGWNNLGAPTDVSVGCFITIDAGSPIDWSLIEFSGVIADECEDCHSATSTGEGVGLVQEGSTTCPTLGVPFTKSDAYSSPAQWVALGAVNCETPTCGGSLIISSVRMRGTGTNPFPDFAC